MKKFAFIYTILLVCQCVLANNPSILRWKVKEPAGDPFPLVNKPIFIAITNNVMLYFNGVLDNCTSQTNTFNQEMLAYQIDSNEAELLTVTGTKPIPTAFGSAWKSGIGKVMIGGGGNYNFFYDFTTFHVANYSTLFEFNYFTNNWKAVQTFGTAPLARMESSVIQKPDDPDIIYLYGGVTPGSVQFDFLSLGDLYKYHIPTKTWTKLANASAIDDGSDGIPKSRYHAHIYYVAETNELEISQGVHRETIFNSVDLLDTWRFNLTSLTWRQVFPHTDLPTQRRHGIDFMIQRFGTTRACTFSGDIPGGLDCCGCLFNGNVPSETYCRDLDANGATADGDWLEIPAFGHVVPCKYCSGEVVNGKLYSAGGHYFENDPLAPNRGQNFLSGVRVLNMRQYND